MILFIAEGRLGNQLFQYAFLQTIRRGNEKIFVYGFDELVEVFDNVECVVLKRPRNRLLRGILNRFIYKLVRPLLNTISSVKLFDSIEVEYDYVLGKYRREKTSFVRNKGLLSKILYVKTGYFQSESFFNPEKIKGLKIKKVFLEEAKRIIELIPQGANKVFVHIRLTDYKNFSVYGKPSVLPMEYFYKIVDWFEKNVDNPFFIILSDEPETLTDKFNHLKHRSMIVKNSNHFGVDFAIMTMCEYGVLSPSTFSWWASYFMANRKLVFYPKHWLGFHSGEEFPAGTSPSFGVAVDVFSGKIENIITGGIK